MRCTVNVQAAALDSAAAACNLIDRDGSGGECVEPERPVLNQSSLP